jgi:hypothetical protein
MDGFSPRNVRRLVTNRVQENLQNIAQASRRKLHSVISNEEPDQPIDNSDQVVDNLSLDSSQESVSENNYNSSSESQQNVVDILDLTEELKCWAINHNITGLAINDLLKTQYWEVQFNELFTKGSQIATEY